MYGSKIPNRRGLFSPKKNTLSPTWSNWFSNMRLVHSWTKIYGLKIPRRRQLFFLTKSLIPKGKAVSTFPRGLIYFLVSYLFTHERRFKDTYEDGSFCLKKNPLLSGWTDKVETYIPIGLNIWCPSQGVGSGGHKILKPSRRDNFFILEPKLRSSCL